MYIHVCHTHLYNWYARSSYSSTAAFNNCYNELTAYTVLAHSYWVSFHNACQCQGHTHQQYLLQLPYNSCRTCLTNHMGFISHHIMPLVINSFRGGHTHTDVRTETILRNQVHAGCRLAHNWFTWEELNRRNISTITINREYNILFGLVIY